jgi:hypothetical protein
MSITEEEAPLSPVTDDQNEGLQAVKDPVVYGRFWTIVTTFVRCEKGNRHQNLHWS